MRFEAYSLKFTVVIYLFVTIHPHDDDGRWDPTNDPDAAWIGARGPEIAQA